MVEARVASSEQSRRPPDVGGRRRAHLHQAWAPDAPPRPPSPLPRRSV